LDFSAVPPDYFWHNRVLKKQKQKPFKKTKTKRGDKIKIKSPWNGRNLNPRQKDSLPA
jgi:hypothetical protein